MTKIISRQKRFILLGFSALTLILCSLFWNLDRAVLSQSVSNYELPYPSNLSYYSSSGNGSNNHDNVYNRYAWDFTAQPSFDDVVAARDGVVISLYEGSNTKLTCCNKLPPNWYQYTNYVVIDHGDGQSTLYAHLKYNSVPVSVGDRVLQGQKIGEIGDTGYASGPHLHYSVQQRPSGQNYGNQSGGYWTTSLPSSFRDQGVLSVYPNGIPLSGRNYTSSNFFGDIGIGEGNGSLWFLGGSPTHGGYKIYSRSSDSVWTSVAGGANRVDVDNSGNPWVVNNNGEIYKWVGTGFQSFAGAGCARDIGITVPDEPWVIGCDARDGGYGIYYWNGSAWENIPGGALRIAVSTGGIPWIVNSQGEIFKGTSNKGWEAFHPGHGDCAKDIGIATDSQPWIIGCNAVIGGYGIYQWDGFEWIGIPGGAENISIGNGVNGISPWVLNSSGDIYQLVDGKWVGIVKPQ